MSASGATPDAVTDVDANDGLRLLLELAALGAFAYWGWATFEGPTRWVATLGVPLLAAALWGGFRVPGDGGEPLVVTPGPLRLALELGLFALAVGLLWLAGRPAAAAAFALLIVVHYAVGRDRITWLLAH